MNTDKTLFGTAFFSITLHVYALVCGMPNLYTQSGEQGKEKMVISFGSIELPAVLADEPDMNSEEDTEAFENSRELLEVEELDEQEPIYPELDIENILKEIKPVEEPCKETNQWSFEELLPPIDDEILRDIEWIRSSNEKPGNPSHTKGQFEDIRTRFLKSIVARIQKVKRYLRLARSKGIKGTAKVEFCISGDGTLVSVSLINSSGYAVLDKEAVQMIERAAPFPPIPEELNTSRMTLSLPIVFELKKRSQ